MGCYAISAYLPVHGSADTRADRQIIQGGRKGDANGAVAPLLFCLELEL